MATATKGLSPDKRESRPALVAQRLPLNCQLGGDNIGNITATLRLQRLAADVGIFGARAQLIAGLAWGEVGRG